MVGCCYKSNGVLTRKDELPVSLQDLTLMADDMVMWNDD